MSCANLTGSDAPVATAARAAATGRVSMLTRPDPERSGAVQIATRRRPSLRVLWTCVSSPTNKNPGYGAFPPDLVQLRSTLPIGAFVLRLVAIVCSPCHQTVLRASHFILLLLLTGKFPPVSPLLAGGAIFGYGSWFQR